MALAWHMASAKAWWLGRRMGRSGGLQLEGTLQGSRGEGSSSGSPGAGTGDHRVRPPGGEGTRAAAGRPARTLHQAADASPDLPVHWTRARRCSA